MAGKGRKIVVEFIGDDKSLSKTSSQVEGKLGRLGGRMGKVGVIAGAALATGVTAAAGALVMAGKAAMEDAASAQKLATTLKNTTGATEGQVAGVEKWITAQGKALGVADDQLRPALSKLAIATGDVGKAQALATLAMDVSAGSGKSLESVSAALAKAQNGNTAGLAKLGLATKDASGEALSFEQIQANLAKTFKGQAAAGANTLAGRVERLKLMFSETMETIGYKLLPVAEKLLGWFVDDALPGITKFGKYLQAKLGPAFAKVGDFLKKFGKDGEATSGKFSKTVSTIKGIVGSLVSIFKSVTSIISSLWKTFGGTILSYASSAFKNLVNVIGGALKVIQGVFKVFASLLKGDWKGVWDGLKLIVSGAWQAIKGIVSQGWNVVKLLFSAAGSAIKGIFGGIWNGIRSAAKSGFNFIVDGIRAVPSKILALGSRFLSAGQTIIGKFIDGLQNAGRFAKDFASGVWNALKTLINSGIDKINAALDFTIKLPAGLGSFRINPRNIPHLYKGGIIPGSKYGTPIIAGDRGHAEAVVPLSGPHAPNLGGNVTIVIQGAVDPIGTARQVEKILTQYKRTTGRQLAFV